MSRLYLLAVICRSRGGLSASGKEEKSASNDNSIFLFIRASSLFSSVIFRITEEKTWFFVKDIGNKVRCATTQPKG